MIIYLEKYKVTFLEIPIKYNCFALLKKKLKQKTYHLKSFLYNLVIWFFFVPLHPHSIRMFPLIIFKNKYLSFAGLTRNRLNSKRFSAFAGMTMCKFLIL